MIFALLCLIIPFILLARKKWAVRVVQTFLIMGAFEWVITLLLLIGQRQSMGRDWTLSAVILGSVAIFTFLSAFVFRAESLKKRYELGKREDVEGVEISDVEKKD